MFVSKYFNIGNIMISHEIIITMLENNRFMFEVGLSLKRYCVKSNILPEQFFDRITEIFMFQMEKKFGNNMLWKLAHNMLMEIL